MKRMVKPDCRVCGGDGFSIEGGDCRACKGSGFEEAREVTHTVYSRGRRYHAFSAREAAYIRDTVGGYVEAE